MVEASDSKLAPGTDVGGYVVETELGHGGMGVVYRATHPVIGKRVAIKVLHPEIAERGDAMNRFTQEARAVNQIGHPNIVDIFGFGTMPDGRAYLMMDLLEGEPLRKRIKRGPLHVSEAASIVDETASALLAAHDKGFIHRDLKPDNVFLIAHDGRWPEVKLLDFGLAKLLPQPGELAAFRTKTGVVLGTPDYMAPELVRKRGEIDHRVDLYALGVMWFEMLTGRRPFLGNDGSFEKLQMIVDAEAPPVRSLAPHVPEELAQLVDTLLAKDREARPSLATVRAAIKRLRGSAQLPSMSLVEMEAAGATLTDAPAVRAATATPANGVPSLAATTVRITGPAAAEVGTGAPAPAPARPSSPPAGMPGLRATGSHGGTVLGVVAPPRPSRSVMSVAAAKPARVSPAWVLLVVLLVLGGAVALVFVAIR